jgi:hypothetical protein
MQIIFWWRTPVELVHLEDREGHVRISLQFTLGIGCENGNGKRLVSDCV